jgi:hypothetical protein
MAERAMQERDPLHLFRLAALVAAGLSLAEGLKR